MITRGAFVTLLGGAFAASAAPLGARAADTADSFGFDYTANEIRAPATVNGRGPVTIILDTGATTNVLFSGAAERLGFTGGRLVKVVGATGDATARAIRADAIAFGSVVLHDQALLVLDVPAAEAIGIDGIIGCNGGVSLFAPFVRDHALATKTPPRFVLSNGGGRDIGGATVAYGVARGAAMQLGGAVLRRPLYRYLNATSGAFARTDTAGNFGCELLSRFAVTLDYRARLVYLRPGTNVDDPFVFDRSGMVLKPQNMGPTVVAVVPGSSAESEHVAPGDVLVAIGGHVIDMRADFTLIQRTFSQPPGTVVPVRLTRANVPYDAQITLRELI